MKALRDFDVSVGRRHEHLPREHRIFSLASYHLARCQAKLLPLPSGGVAA